MASGRLRRNRSLGGYLTSLEQTATNLNTRQNYLTTGLASGSVSESALSEELIIANKNIQTENFVEGYSGWRISGNGDAEFGSVVVRGDINAYSGTIGYWNISTPAVSRVIGPYTLLGTFIESSAAGSNDVGTTTGTYVGMYKSYSPEELVVTSKTRSSNVATLTVENHQYIVGDYVTVELEDDTTFNNGSVPVLVTAATNDTFSYDSVGSDVSESAATGTAQLYNPDVAGLYLRDYGKREFDYGYFSSAGVAYVSAEDMNILENPSFEYKDGSNVITSSSTSWTAGTGLTLTLDNFTSLNGAAINTQTPTYSAPNITLTTATAHNIQPNEYVVISGITPTGYNGFWRAQTGTTGTTLVVNIGSNPGTITSGGDVVGLKQYDYESKFGGRVTWTTSGLSTYFEGKLDYAAGSDYTIFANGRTLYFGATVYPYYIPPYFGKTSVARYNLTGTFTGATANATAITYTGTGLNFVADQWLSVTGFTSTAYNITSGKIFSANATTVIVPKTGITPSTATGTGTGTAGLFVATTSSTHSFVADDIIFFDFKFGKDIGGGEISPYFAPHTLPDATSGYSFKVLSYPAPTSTTFYVSADDVYANLAGTILYESRVNLDTRVRDQGFYRAYHPAIDISQVRLKYSNANTTPLSNVVSVATKAQWDAGTNKYYLTTADKYMEGYLDPDVGIPVMTKSDAIIIDADLLESNYKIQDPTGYAAQSDITFQIPGWMYKHNGAGNVTATKITASTAIGYILDNAYVATNNRSYYGNNLETNRWYDNTVTNPAQASVEGTKTWIDIDLSTQDAQLDYLSRVGFKGTNFSKLLYSNPGISAITQETSKLVNYTESESLTFSSGEYQYLSNATTYRKINSYLQTQVGDGKTSFELVANADDITISSGASSNTDYAMVGGYFDSLNNQTKVVVHASEFKYTHIDETISPSLYIFRADSYGFYVTGEASIAGPLAAQTIRLSSTDDVTLASTTHAFQVGEDSTLNLRIDDNEIQAVNNGAASALSINVLGGNVSIGNTTSTVSISGSVDIGGGYGTTGVTITSAGSVQADNSLTTGGSVIRTALIGGGTTGASINDSGALIRTTSSARYKQDIQNAVFSYQDILSLEPKTFKLKDEAESDNTARTYAGFIAEDLHEIETLRIFVNYLKQSDGSLVPDGIQYGELVSALVSAIKHQNGMITALETRIATLEGN